jgi:hypothetical protein
MHGLRRRMTFPFAIALVAATAAVGPGAAKEAGDWQPA